MENSMKNNDEIEIDLRQIFIVIMSKIAIILLVGVIFGLAAFIGSKLLLKPVYQSQTSLYVLNKQSQGTTTLSDLQSSTQLTQDYMILVKSRTVTEKVIRQMKSLQSKSAYLHHLTAVCLRLRFLTTTSMKQKESQIKWRKFQQILFVILCRLKRSMYLRKQIFLKSRQARTA